MRKVLALAAIASLLTGCAQIPRSSSVGLGPEINAGDDSQYIYYSPSLPTKGDNQIQIVSGFLSAGNGPQNDYSTARAYLSTARQATWKPSKEVLIEAAPPKITKLSETVLDVDVQIQATIDEKGVYSTQSEGTTRHLQYHLLKQSGQWRIHNAPDLTVVAQPNFQVLFRSYSVYYYDRNHSYLVPDVRWFPSRSATATHLAAAVLAGPQSWLAPAVAEDSYGSFGLNTDAVTINDGVASIDLDSRAMKVPKRTLQYVKAELRNTLLQLPQVTAVSISISKNIQNVADIQTQIGSTTSGQLIALNALGLSVSNSSKILYSRSELETLVGGQVTDFALNNSGNLALVTSHGAYRTQPAVIGGSPKLVDSRTRLLSPQFDNRGVLWTVSAAKNSSWLVSDPGGTVYGVKRPPNLRAVSVSSFAISPDGSRLAVATRGTSAALYVMPIIRNETGIPMALGVGVKILVSSASVKSVSWSDSIHLATLELVEAGVARPSIRMVGGQVQSFALLYNAKTVVSLGGSSAFFVLSADGSVLQLKNSLWNQVQSGATALHYSN